MTRSATRPILPARWRQGAPVGWALVDQAFASGANFLTMLIVARALGAEEFGRFVLAWFALYFLQNVQIALITAPMKTMAVRWPGRRRAPYLGAAWTQQMALSVAGAGLAASVALASAIVKPDWRLDELALPLALLVAAGQVPEFFRMAGYVQDRIALSTAISALRYLTQIALLIVLTVWFTDAASVATALWAMSAATALPSLIGIAAYRLPIPSVRLIKRVAWRHWVFARWLVASMALIIGRENFVSVAVGSWLGLAEVGILRAAEQLVMLVNVPLQGLGNLITVRASRAYEAGGTAGLKGFLKLIALYLMVPLAGLLAVIGLLGDPILSLVYGADYAGHGAVVALYAVAMITHLVKALCVYAAWAMQRTRIEFWATIFGVAVSAVLAIPLIATFGIAGAVLAEIVFVSLAVLGFLPIWAALGSGANGERPSPGMPGEQDRGGVA
ncbi:MAG: lipopolysaccharide biosynthesis protein [Pseudomonadota bacterium]